MKTQRVGMVFLRPQLEQFTAQVFGGEDVEGAEGLVHEEDLRLDHECTGKADALLHAAGELLGIGGFKTIETDGIEHAHAAGTAFFGVHAACLERCLDILKHGEPGEEGKALEDDRYVDFGFGDWFFVPVDLPARRARQAGKHAEHGGFARAGGAEQGDDFSGDNGQVGGRNHLDAILAGLRVVLLDLFGANDRLGGARDGFAIGAIRRVGGRVQSLVLEACWLHACLFASRFAGYFGGGLAFQQLMRVALLIDEFQAAGEGSAGLE